LTAALTGGLALGSVQLARCPQLVTFVQAHPADTAQLAQPLPRPYLGNARAVLTAWKQPNPEHTGHAYMTDIKATAQAEPTSPANLSSWTRPSARNLAGQPTPRMTPNTTPRQVLLKAEVPDPAQAAPQGWLVLTAWEEVAAPDQTPDQNAKAEVPASTPSEDAPSQPSSPATPPAATSQIRVTRMVFRVVPASFVSPSPTTIRTSDGWLVIQM
jgi:hypothetical protein